MPQQVTAAVSTAASSNKLAVVHNWQLGRKLGSGAYAEVRAAHKVNDASTKVG